MSDIDKELKRQNAVALEYAHLMQSFVKALYAMEQLEKKNSDPAAAVDFKCFLNNLRDAFISLDTIRSVTEEQAEQIQNLMRKRSDKDAFIAGEESAYSQIMAGLSAEDQVVMRHVIEQIRKRDQGVV